MQHGNIISYIIFESIYVLQMKSRKVGGLSEQANEAGGGQGGGGQGGGAQAGRGGEVTPASTVTDLKEKAYQGNIVVQTSCLT